jgi:ribosomal protein S18 acetylase RimI-like enzyme
LSFYALFVALKLRTMRDDELPAYIERSRGEYAAELEAQAGYTHEDAQRKAEEDWARILPDAKRPEGNYVFAVEDEAGERVGHLYWAERNGEEGRVAFIYDVEVYEQFRGRGYGRETMQLLEDDVRAQGITKVSLSVFGGNEVARKLYASMGYAERAIFMSKTLEAAPQPG